MKRQQNKTSKVNYFAKGNPMDSHGKSRKLAISERTFLNVNPYEFRLKLFKMFSDAKDTPPFETHEIGQKGGGILRHIP